MLFLGKFDDFVLSFSSRSQVYNILMNVVSKSSHHMHTDASAWWKRNTVLDKMAAMS